MHGLSRDQWRDLLLSLNTHKQERRLTPYQAAMLVSEALKGTSVDELAEDLGFRDTTTLRRIHRLSELTPGLADLVEWGSRPGMVSMSTAAEILRLPSRQDAEEALKRAIEARLTKEEARQVVQIRLRSGEPIEACIRQALETRPRIERYELVLGALTTPAAQKAVAAIGDKEASRILRRRLAAEFPEVICRSARVTQDRFTLLFGEADMAKLRERLGAFSLEEKVSSFFCPGEDK